MSKPQPVNIDGKSENEQERFILALRKILKVSHAEMQARLAAEKQAKVSKHPVVNPH